MAKKKRAPAPASDPATDPDADLAAPLPDEPPPPRVLLTRRHREWLATYAESGFRDPEAAASAVGFRDPTIGHVLVVRLRQQIEQERARRTVGHEMGMEEALRELAAVARQSDDLKTKLAAIRTVLEVHGALGKDVDPRDRKKLIREAEELMGEIRKSLPAAPGALDPRGDEADLGSAGAVLEAEIVPDRLQEPIVAGATPPLAPGSDPAQSGSGSRS